MSKHKTLTDSSGEVRELTAQDFTRFKSAAQVLPPALQATLGVRKRGPQKTPTKQPIKLRVDPDVLAALREAGDGWQTRINDMLRASLRLSGRL